MINSACPPSYLAIERWWARREVRLCPPSARTTPSLLHQRTLARLERFCCVLRCDRGDGLVVIPRIFRLLGLLYLEQIGRNDPAAVDPQRALAEQGIVGRNLLHPGDDLGAVMRIAAERFHR